MYMYVVHVHTCTYMYIPACIREELYTCATEYLVLTEGCAEDESRFACSNGLCINMALRCDAAGHDDCGDGSDEFNCPPPGTTSE